MQLEIDILKATLDVLKKDPGVDRSSLKNWEKAAVIDALKNKYSLPTLLNALRYARSSYFYREKGSGEKVTGTLTESKEKIRADFSWKIIHVMAIEESIRHFRKGKAFSLSEKVIRRLMKQEHLQPKGLQKKRILLVSGRNHAGSS
jgi:putative transposase